MSNHQRICIGPVILAGSDDPISMILPNPSSGLPSRYVIQSNQLFEMQQIDPDGSKSWFIGETIQQDGSLYMVTPVDPAFILLFIMDILRQQTTESGGRFLVMDDIFEHDQYTSLRHLADLDRIQQHLGLVCDHRVESGYKSFRLNDEKALAWLQKKVTQVVDQFENVPILVHSIAYTESLPADCRQEALLQASLKLVSAYVSDKWAERLGKEYSFPALDKLESRTQLPAISDYGKRSGMDLDDEDIKPSKEVNKKPKLSVGQRKLEKASKTGMKTMQSFFKKL